MKLVQYDMVVSLTGPDSNLCLYVGQDSSLTWLVEHVSDDGTKNFAFRAPIVRD